MSSSRSRHRSKRSSSSTSSYYPSEWSNWEWDGDQKDWMRYRLVTADEYEYQYESQTATTTTSNPTEPRTAQALDSIQEGSYSASANYALSTDPLAEITRGLAQTTLDTNNTSYQTSAQYVGSSYPTHITTTNPHTDKEEFDPHYKVQEPFKFKRGQVFKVLWSEPQGSGGGRGDESSNPGTITERVNKYGESTFQKVRRFVIIRALPGHCICLPINTYSKQGVTKKGVHASDHTIAYSGSKPTYFPGEKSKGLTRKPLKIVLKSPRHKLDEASRLNYAKTYTVEYNVKVWFIGNVHQDSMWYLFTDYNQVHPPLETSGLTEPSAFQDGETSYADGGMYTQSSQTYGSSYVPEQQYYAGSYSQPQVLYSAPTTEQHSSHSSSFHSTSRVSRSRGKGKDIQRDHAPQYDIPEERGDQDYDYAQQYGETAGSGYEAQYEAQSALHPGAAEYDPNTYTYPATTEGYVETAAAHGAEETYYPEEAEHTEA